MLDLSLFKGQFCKNITKVQRRAWRQGTGARSGLIREEIQNAIGQAEVSRQYYEPFNQKSISKALDDLDLYLEAEGPFDGLLGFSQGASLAAAYILMRHDNSRRDRGGVVKQSTIKCAVFLCGRPPFIDLPAGAPMDVADGQRIEIPTAHIFGKNDHEEGDGAHRANRLMQICNPQARFSHAHDGGHEVPGARDMEALLQSAFAIRRMLREVERMTT